MWNLTTIGINSENCGLIVLTSSLDGWMFLDRAYALNEGELLTPNSPSRDIGKYGSVNESLGVKIPFNMLKKHQNNGLSVKMQGSRGHVSFTIPSYYIQGFLEATNK